MNVDNVYVVISKAINCLSLLFIGIFKSLICDFA